MRFSQLSVLLVAGCLLALLLGFAGILSGGFIVCIFFAASAYGVGAWINTTYEADRADREFFRELHNQHLTHF